MQIDLLENTFKKWFCVSKGNENKMLVGQPTNGDSLGEVVIFVLSNFYLREKEQDL
jgi:hypothetical protein